MSKLQEKINAAINLDELCEILNSHELAKKEEKENSECFYFQPTRTEDDCDLCDLPTFGGTDPVDTCEIFSWDESRVLISNDCLNGEDWELVKRTEDFGK